jgi:hypothetical protein
MDNSSWLTRSTIYNRHEARHMRNLQARIEKGLPRPRVPKPGTATSPSPPPPNDQFDDDTTISFHSVDAKPSAVAPSRSTTAMPSGVTSNAGNGVPLFAFGTATLYLVSWFAPSSSPAASYPAHTKSPLWTVHNPQPSVRVVSPFALAAELKGNLTPSLTRPAGVQAAAFALGYISMYTLFRQNDH